MEGNGLFGMACRVGPAGSTINVGDLVEVTLSGSFNCTASQRLTIFRVSRKAPSALEVPTGRSINGCTFSNYFSSRNSEPRPARYLPAVIR